MNKSYVYIIGAKPSGPVKVGYSSKCANRLASLQTGSHLNLELVKKWRLNCTNAVRLERTAHKALAKFHLKGEWFSCSPEVAIAAILSIRQETSGFRRWVHYKPIAASPSLSKAAMKGGKANAKQAELNFWRRFKTIQGRWHGPATNQDLLKEAGIKHHDTVRSYLLYTRWEWRRLTDAKRASVLKQRLADMRKRYPDEQI